MAIQFTIHSECGDARSGVLTTPHGEIQTPFFMPVGTVGAVKGITPAALREAGAEIVLANTYHLAIRPGEELVQAFGGLAAFSGWRGPMLTDSGGYQVFSLAERRRITDDGIWFKNHVDGGELDLTPETAVRIQQALGADMFMALDECPAADATREDVARAVDRTTAWAARSGEAWATRDTQALFGIVQGGVFEDLRQKSAEEIIGLDFPGNAIGGVSVGESPEAVEEVVSLTAPLLPRGKPRYLMGVGRPEDMLRAISHGVDMFDCVMPTRHARHAQAFTSQGTLNLRNARFREDKDPIDPGCTCYACETVSRGYLRHLFNVNEMLSSVYVTIHNLSFYLGLMAEARRAIRDGLYSTFLAKRLAEL